MTVFDSDRVADHIAQRIGYTSVIRGYGRLPLVCVETGVVVEAPVLEIGTIDTADAEAPSART